MRKHIFLFAELSVLNIRDPKVLRQVTTYEKFNKKSPFRSFKDVKFIHFHSFESPPLFKYWSSVILQNVESLEIRNADSLQPFQTSLHYYNFPSLK
jgi:hypothetical protein